MKTYFFYALAEFINLISSESNEVCNREEKRTIAPEHVLKALEVFQKSYTLARSILDFGLSCTSLLCILCHLTLRNIGVFDTLHIISQLMSTILPGSICPNTGSC